MATKNLTNEAQSNEISCADLAEIAGLTPRRIQQLQKDAVLPVQHRRGFCPFEESLSALFEYYRGLVRKGNGNIADEKLKGEQLRNERLEMEVAAQKGELIPVKKALLLWQEVCGTIKERLLALPSKMAARLPATRNVETDRAAIETEVRAVLDELSKPVGYSAKPNCLQS